MSTKRQAQKLHLLAFTEFWPGADRVISNRLNFPQDRQAAFAKQFDISPHRDGNHIEQGSPLLEERASTIDFKSHQFAKCGRETAGMKIAVVETESASVLIRQIDSAEILIISPHVLPEIGELQTGANVVGERGPGRVETFTKIKNQSANGIRRILAIAEQLVEGRVTFNTLVLLEGGQ